MQAYRLTGICFALAAVTLVVFIWCCRNDFVNYDDGVYVTENPYVKAGLTAEGASWAFTTYHAGNWHPLTWLSLELDAEIYGIRPWGFHLNNVLLHTANTILLFCALLALVRAGQQNRGRESFLPQSGEKPSAVVSGGGKGSGPLFCCAMVAALFAVHPLHVESVAWVAERKDVLSSFFWMVSLLAYAWYVSRPRWTRYLAVAAAMALGLLAKPMLVTLPFVFLLLDYWPLGRYIGERTEDRGKKKRITTSLPHRPTTSPPHYPTTPQQLLSRFGVLQAEKIPLFALSAASSIITWRAQLGPAIRSLAEYPLTTRLANALVSYCAYIGQALWPAHLGVYYPHPAGEITTSADMAFPLWEPIGAFLFLSGISIFAVSKMRSIPYLFVGWFWYLGTLVPVVGVVQLAGIAHADRYTYIPLIGLFLAAVWGTAELTLRWGYQKAAARLSVLLLVLLMSLSFVQASYWHDGRELWQHALDACGESAVAHTNLALELRKKGELHEAVRHDRQSLLIDDNNSVAHNQLGVSLIMLSEQLAAIAKRDEARRLQEEAFAEWEKAIQLHPEWEQPRYNKALALSKQEGGAPKAIEEYLKVLDLRYDFAQAHFNLALLLDAAGKHHDADYHFQEALRIAAAKGQNDQVRDFQNRLQTYQSRKSSQ
jgi:tetratricopeptide (TPR) repeat protein